MALYDSDLNAFPEYVANGDVDSIKAFLQSDVERVKLAHSSSVCLACHNQHYDVVKLLLDHGFDVNQHDRHERSALSFSVEQDDVKMAELLLQNGADITNNDILVLAVRRSLAEILGLLVDYGADTNVRDSYGQTLLHYAILQDSAVFTFLNRSVRMTVLNRVERIIRILLNNGSDVNAKTENGFAPLHYAVKLKYPSIVTILLEYGADIHTLVDRDIKTPRVARFRKKSNQDLGRHNVRPTLTSILHIALEVNDLVILKLLLHAGADVDLPQSDGRTPLMLATKLGLEKAVEILLEFDADLERRDKYGMTALHICCRQGSINILNLLLKAGADVNATSNKGKVPYHYILQLEEDFKCEMMFVDQTYNENSQLRMYYQDSVKIKKTLRKQIYLLFLNNLAPEDPNTEMAIRSQRFSKNLPYQEMEEFSKNFIFCNNISLYDVLKKIGNPFYIRNPIFQEKLKENVDVINSKFPTLGNIAQYLARRAVTRVDLIHRGSQLFMDLTGTNKELPKLPSEVVETIMSFLVDADIRGFLKCEVSVPVQ